MIGIVYPSMDRAAQLACCVGAWSYLGLELVVAAFFCSTSIISKKEGTMQNVQNANLQNVNLLDGKWEFIGKETYSPSIDCWTNYNDYVKGMTWQFVLEFACEGQEQGTIIESAPNVTDVEMKYIYDLVKSTLTVDIEIQDIYEVIYSTLGTPQNPVIRLNILTSDLPAPYWRYILRRV